MKETETVKMSPKKQSSPISKGLLMVPKTAGSIHLGINATLQTHRRVGSTGTTGDESGTTDEDDNNIDNDEIDMSIKLCDKHHDNFGSYSDIATITDKIQLSPPATTTISTTNSGKIKIHRNSSDSSVYSDLGLEKLVNNNIDDGIDDVDWARSVVEAKEQTFSRLKDELRYAHEELKLKDEEVARLTRIRQDVEAELEDLTASLFQEAHNMVREANEKQAAAEKALKESQMKVDVLTAEVAALKTLVLTSTPSRPNPHLHPQIDTKNPRNNNNNDDNNVNGSTKKHRRSPSHFNLKYGRENSPPESPIKEIIHHIPCEIETKDNLEVDPDLHREFLNWRQKPGLDKNDPFIQRIYVEDINLCLNFNCKELSNKVSYAVENGIILIEAVGDRTKAMFPKKCALLEVPRLCFYRMNIGEADVWYNISQICRNRIIAVCDFLNYLKYIERGLVKSSVHDVYWEIVRLRKDMVLARLGLNLSS